MNIFSSESFFGLILIFGGATIILKTFWGIDIPFFKVMFAILLIYLGLLFLFGKPSYRVTWSKRYTYINPHDNEHDDRS